MLFANRLENQTQTLNLRRPVLRTSFESKSRILAGLALFTVFALLVQGYHPYAEDAEIYLPGVLKILNPALFPANTEFFGEHAGHSLYPNLIAFSARATHLSIEWATLLWQIVAIFLLLAATWRLSSALFEKEFEAKLDADVPSAAARCRALRFEYAGWGSVGLMAALLTLPLAGTSLYIMDQYLNPRNLAAFAVLFAVAEVLHRKFVRATLWLIFGAAIHPFMATFGILFCLWIILLDRYHPRALGFAIALPFGITFAPPPPQYHQVALLQRAHFILRWEWYEWLGVIGPLALFWYLSGWARRREAKNLELVSRAMVPFVAIATLAAIGLGIPARFEALTRLQPMRCLALGYMILVVIAGGLLGEYVVKGKVWRRVALFVPLGLVMFFAQRQVFPSSSHIEWPWAQPHNSWAQAFDWIRLNTPVDALFALDPRHMELPGEDEIGFRARAERSMLADLVKDKGATSMFPPLSVEWAKQVDDQRNFEHFDKRDFERLRQQYGVTWVVVQQSSAAVSDPAGLLCPYENSAVRVCRLE